MMSNYENMTRQSNWPGLLAEFVNDHMDKKFKYGKQDCAMLAAKWVFILTKINLGKEYKYESQLGADRILKHHGGVRGIADKHFPRVGLNFARRGDLVALKVSSDPPAWKNTSLGILLGREAIFAGPEGLSFLPRKELMKTAWRAG